MANTRRLKVQGTRYRRIAENIRDKAAGIYGKTLKLRREPDSYYEAPRSEASKSVTLPKFKCLED